MIKFLNQLSERDKAAAIKFLIATLKNSTKEQFKYWSDEDRSVWFDSTRIFDRKTTTTSSTSLSSPSSSSLSQTTETALTAVSCGNFEQQKTLAAAVDNDDAVAIGTTVATAAADAATNNNYDDDVCMLKWPIDTGLSISLENIKSEGNFNTALVPFNRQEQEQKPYQSHRCASFSSLPPPSSYLRSRFCVFGAETPFGRDIKTLFNDFGFDGRYSAPRDLLKIFLNQFIFDHSNDDRSLVRVHQQIDHLKPEAKLTEIKDEDGEIEIEGEGDGDGDIDDDDDDIDRIMEVDENTQKSSEESLPETGDKNDGDPSQNKSPRKRKLYKCFQCPKL